MAAVIFYAMVIVREVVSIWIGIFASISVLFWFRFPRLRWFVVVVVGILLLTGIMFPAVYEFAGGDAEWQQSGVSRVDLINRVLEVTKHNPITGLGPASYRLYAEVEPLVWRGGSSLWIGATVASHNNYVDIYSYFGLVGLFVFLWFMLEVLIVALRLRRRFSDGFAGGYVNGIIAAWAGTMVIMAFADWFLPFVYNVGFPGFQASALIWIFMGGLVALSAFSEEPETL